MLQRGTKAPLSSPPQPVLTSTAAGSSSAYPDRSSSDCILAAGPKGRVWTQGLQDTLERDRLPSLPTTTTSTKEQSPAKINNVNTLLALDRHKSKTRNRNKMAQASLLLQDSSFVTTLYQTLHSSGWTRRFWLERHLLKHTDCGSGQADHFHGIKSFPH